MVDWPSEASHLLRPSGSGFLYIFDAVNVRSISFEPVGPTVVSFY